MKRLFNDEQEKYILNNYMTMPYSKIAKNLGEEFTERQIRGWINSHGLRKLSKINDTYFNDINTPEKAYFLGLIYADGWIVDNPINRNYEFAMQLQSQDKYMLENIRLALNSPHPIKILEERKTVINGVETVSHEMGYLRVYSKKIVKALEENGIVQNKTNSIIFPKLDKYFFDYLRGYIDGDGCYYYNQNKRLLNISITCSNDLNLKYIQDMLKNYNIESSVYMEKEKKYRLIIFKKESVLSLLGFLYYDINLVCLKRKREKVNNYLGFLNGENR